MDPNYNQPVVQKKGFAVASMVLGIVSIVLGLCVWYVTIPASIIGLILGALCKKANSGTNAKTGMATAGIVLCIISLAFSVLGIFGLAALLGLSI